MKSLPAPIEKYSTMAMTTVIIVHHQWTNQETETERYQFACFLLADWSSGGFCKYIPLRLTTPILYIIITK